MHPIPITTAQTVLNLLRAFEARYSYVMRWESPPLTLALLLLFSYACLFADAERAGALAVFGVLAVMTYALWERATGRCVRGWRRLVGLQRGTG